MYESPLTIVESIANQIVKQKEDRAVYEIRQAIGYNIDKQELIKALQYDRNQYQKGYADAMAVLEDIKSEIERRCNITVGSDNEPAMTLHDIFKILDKRKEQES